jgi:hypothetical protein
VTETQLNWQSAIVGSDFGGILCVQLL